ncbi:MAG: hypothetical protein NZ772_13575 [Cyanobacteria bacterium]|nr:hypothetical protein [Cyanobacteriota bacterium]MDW8202423.1 hypothetical protein [Cyanobacteriota bacterium SKYGB_h_bin112]
MQYRYKDDGRVPQHVRRIDGTEPNLLDILEIPLDKEALDFGFERENWLIMPGAWKRLGRASLADVVTYANGEIMYPKYKRAVPLPYLESLPRNQQKTLQLLKVVNFRAWINAEEKYRASLVTTNGHELHDAPITDPVFIKKLDIGDYRNNRRFTSDRCLVTLSLGMPFAKEKDGEKYCWKLIAGVIEIAVS